MENHSILLYMILNWIRGNNLFDSLSVILYCRTEKTQILKPKPIIIVEGLLILHLADIRQKLNIKIFLDTDDDVRLSKRG